MHCDDFLPLISGHLDGCNTETEEKALLEHLQHCTRCRELLAQMEQNDQLLSHMTEPPANLSTRIMDAVRKEPRKTKRKRWYASITAAGLATAALLALVLFGSTGLPAMDAVDSAMEMIHDAPADQAAGGDLFRAEAQMQDDYLNNSVTTYGQTAESGNGACLTSPSTAPTEQKDILSDQLCESPETGPLYAAEISGGLPLPGDLPMRMGAADAYGLVSVDGSVQEIPTLIIQDADIADFPDLKFLPMDTDVQTMPTVFDSEADFYERFLSSLPTEYSLLGSGTLREMPRFSLSRYSLPYDSFIALLEAAAGKYELSVYLPTDPAEAEACLVIFVCCEE